jgi:hypothetical protein
MSMHKIPLTPIEEAGLRAHGLDIGTPSQLSDAFRQGIAWAQSQGGTQEPSHGEQVRDGWKLVPCQPTDAMVQAVLDSGIYHTPATAWPILVEEYKAMLAAAPSAGSQEQGE